MAVQEWFQSENVEMSMFSLLEEPQQLASTASGTVPSATPLRGTVGARESSAVAEAPTSSAGAASTVVPAAAPATGGAVFPTTSVGGAARAPAPADKTAASTAAQTASGTVTSTTPLRGAVGARESAEVASSHAVAEAAPSIGDITAPDASVERAARKPGSVAGTSNIICGKRRAPTGIMFPLEVRYHNNSSSNDNNTSNYGPWWDTTCVIALLRPFDPGKRCRRSTRRGKAVLGMDLPFHRGKSWGRMQHGG